MTAIPPGWTPEQARKRWEAATTGPWSAEYGVLRSEATEAAQIDSEADAAFIANAPQDIAALLALLDEARETLGGLLRAYDNPDYAASRGCARDAALARAFLARFAAPEDEAT